MFDRVHERRVTAQDEGTDWLYVDPVSRSQHRVEIDVVPDKAQKIRIQHLDREMHGRSEWVPIARAKVPWALRDDYDETMRLWDNAEEHRPPSAQYEVALLLFDAYVDETVATVYYSGVTGILEIHDLQELADICGLPADEITSHEDTFEDGATYAPWPTTLRVLRALCERDPQPALELLGQRRADGQRFAKKVAKEGDPWWAQGVRDGDKWAKRVQHWHDLEVDSVRFLHTLVDARVPSLAEDFLELRQMYLDLVRMMPDAISRIRMVRAQLSEDLSSELQRLIDRPLPKSGEILGAERPDDSE